MVTGRGALETWAFSFEYGDVLRLTASDPRGSKWVADGDDWFEALTKVRRQLDPMGFTPLCNGARIDARPSGMSAQMSDGEVIYILKMGRAATQRVATFDEAKPSQVGTVFDQERYFDAWMAGPKRRGLFRPVVVWIREMWSRR